MDAPHFNAGSYKTAGAGLLDKEDLDQSHRSSGSVTLQSVQAPPVTAGYKGYRV